VNANMNATTDQAWVPFIGANVPYRVRQITATNASISLTTAVGGIYPAASKGGTALVAATQVFSALTGPTLAVDLTLVATPGNTFYAPSTIQYLSLTTPQGAAATANLWWYGEIYQ